MKRTEISLDYDTVRAIAREVAKILKRDELPDLVTTEQAARILGITPSRMRQIKDKFPHMKKGADKQGKLLFVKSKLIESASC
jgi:tRNA U34 5-carboxymethylaminomethyl modifying enzyme MnmG/GidA